MNSPMIEIHEFSTGIRPERTLDGGWVSRGFTGQYMNMTLPSIPPVVEGSIANREFALTEGASRNSPGLIGRVVGSGGEAWSVVAIVTRGKDEKGRSLSVYRYFLCRGENNLRLILGWWENQDMPRFNPFDTRTLGRPHLFDADSLQPPDLHQEALALPVNQPEPILLPPEQRYDLQTINALAFKKFNLQNKIQPVSWAFNVEALEQPRRFQVIYAASPRGYEILDRAIKNTPKLLGPVIGDEEAIKSAIRGLMNSSQVRREAVQTITEALQNKQISKEYWHSWFNGQGADTAISQKIYTPQMVRLITLRAMVIPETLPEFLAWLNIKGDKKPDEHQKVSLEFQSAIRDLDLFPKEKLADGIKFILPKLLEKEITPESVNWLLMVKGSAWFTCRKKFTDDVEADLNKIANHGQSTHVNTFQERPSLSQEDFKCGFGIWKELIKYWQHIPHSSKYTSNIYKPLAELFKYMKDYLLSAFFYQVSDGVVPKYIYNNVSSQPVFGLPIKPKVSRFERFLEFIQDNPEFFIVVGIWIFFGLGLYIYKFVILASNVSSSNEQDKVIYKTSESTSQKGSNSPTPQTELFCKNSARPRFKEIPKNKQKKAIDNFGTTKKAITGLVDQLAIELVQERVKKGKIQQTEKKGTEEQFKKYIKETAIKCILSNSVNPKKSGLDYASTFEKNKSYNRKAWINAIYNYQINKDYKNGYGIINPPNDEDKSNDEDKFQTYKDLRKDIKEYLNQQS
ncbi:MAG: hypothetical protein QNJ63_14580 [Calothrix sp. MO_192.B10]|nr:hypothetical protein [Calothrix sp. MO_192.B10]